MRWLEAAPALPERDLCTAQGVGLDCPVCNRGALGVDSGVSVSFDASFDAGAPFCKTTTNASLLPGVCTNVSCTWNNPPRGTPTDVHVFVDSDGKTSECFEKNNEALLRAFTCPP